jgi:proline dehydrogenase
MSTLSFNELKTAYAHKTDKEIRFTQLVFTLLHYPWLVKILSYAAKLILQYNLPFKGIIRSTVFKVFCSGENEAEAFQTIRHLHDYNVMAVLDYVSEGEKSEEAFSRNAEKIIANINAEVNGTKADFISVKLTGLEDPDFLTQINHTHNQLSGTQQNRYNRFRKHVEDICRAAAEKNIMVYIDAEETWMQEVIDSLTEQMMKQFNHEKVIVFNTLQMYRTDRVAYLQAAIARARQYKYLCGIKLVRGAYLEKETRHAAEVGLPNPVFEKKSDTDKSFNTATEICLQNHDVVVTCIASHNEESVQYAIDCLKRYNVTNPMEKLQFSQLYGMSDHITFNLAAHGFHASKYLPYGEVEKAIPYLMRRAEENTSVNGQMNRELDMLKKEMKRRQHSDD